MGLFGGGKKKKVAAEDTERRKRSKSRRIVAPGAARQSEGDTRHATSKVRRGPERPGGSSGVEKPRPKTTRSSKPAATQSAADTASSGADPVVQERAHNDVLELDLEASSGGHAVITADVGGDDGATLGGVSRTGDQALYDFLVNKAQLLTPDQVETVRAKAQEDDVPADVACTQLGFFDEAQLVKSLTEECWVPHLKVEKYAIRKKALDTVSQTDAITYGVLPVDKLGSILNLAMVNPLDVETIRLLEQKTGLDIKKVVATRGEIEAGIGKYYGGVEDGDEIDQTLGIEQDIPSQRVTQMLANVAGSEAQPQTDPAILAAASKPTTDPFEAADIGTGSMVPGEAGPLTSALGRDDDIIDIDDLLGSSEAIKPVAVQPIAISEDEFDTEDDADLFDAAVTAAHAKPQAAAPEPEEEPEPAVVPAATAQPVAAQDDVVGDSDDLELLPDDDDDEEVIAPSIDLAAAQVDSEPAPEVAAAKPPPVAARPAPAPAPAPVPAPAAAAASAPAASRPRKRVIVDLVAVREEEFQHAISHGKARVFEKWAAIQTRNRILNAVPVGAELDDLLAPLYAGPTVVASVA